MRRTIVTATLVALAATSSTAFSCAPLIGACGARAGAGRSHHSAIHAGQAGAVHRRHLRIAAVLNANGHDNGDNTPVRSDDMLVGGFFSIFVVCASLMLWSVCVSQDFVQPLTWHAHTENLTRKSLVPNSIHISSSPRHTCSRRIY